MDPSNPKQKEMTIRGLAHWIAMQSSEKQYAIAQDALTEHEYFCDHPVTSQNDLLKRKRYIEELNREGIFIKSATVGNALRSAIRSIQIAEQMIYAAEFN